jgi:thiaminase/transcriptional activator TenA
MTDGRFCEDLRKSTDAIWGALREHPFVRGIGDGSLPREKFAFYLIQDYLYLLEFARVLATAAGRSRSAEDLGFFFDLLKTTLEMELQFHRKTCTSFGINVQDLQGTEPGLATVSYSSFLMRTCYEGETEDILAALLPCESGFAELGLHLRSKGLPENPHYRGWIETYCSPEFLEVARRFEERLDASAASASPEDKSRWYRLYQTAVRLELLFFEMSWRRQPWMGIVPTA